MAVFESTYATGYDALYREKDYISECNLIENAAKRNGIAPRKILDIGCGTGGHSIELAKRGYLVTGLDLSNSMISLAKGKAQAQMEGLRVPEFFQGDAKTFNLLEKDYDLAVMMFAVVGYLTTNEELTEAFENIARHLKPGGVFICDFWWGPAVLTERPGDRVRLVTTENGRLLRSTQTSLDTVKNTATVEFQLFQLSKDLPATQTNEIHQMRYFFGPEIELLMKCGGIKLSHLAQFSDLNLTPTDTSWNAVAIGQKI